jgi:DNA-binding SARP family transcriptional activator
VARLEIRLLGSFEVTLDGHPVRAFETNSGRALLAYLAADSSRVSSRPAVAEMLWPDRAEGAALSNLRHTLSVLRQALGESEAARRVLRADRSRISLDAAADVWIDLAEFERLASTPADDATAVAAWESAAGLWRGPLLEGLDLQAGAEWDEWRLVTAERARRLMTTVLHNLVDHHERAGDHGAAIPIARRLADVDPWDEAVHRRLMRLLASAGGGAEALAHYEAIAARFAAELDVSLVAETVALAERIRAGDVARDGDDIELVYPDFLARQAQAARQVFVGRKRELDHLDVHLDAALQGRGRVVFIAGEAGSGKSMLASEFLRRATEVSGVVVAHGRCNAFGGLGDPYLPFRELFGLLCGDVETGYSVGALDREQSTRLWEAMPHTARLLSEVGPDLAGVVVNGALLLDRVEQAVPGAGWIDDLRDVVVGPVASDRLQPALFDEVTAVLGRLSITRPLVLVVDDLQWADAGSVALLWHLARRVESMRVLLVGIYRPEEIAAAIREGPTLEQIIAELSNTTPDCVVELGDDRAFVDEFLDAEPNVLDREFRDRLYGSTRGHALFTAELVRGMRARAEIRRGADGVWVAGDALDWTRLPERIDAAISQRMSQLSDELARDLAVASVQGEEFVAEVVGAVEGDPAAATRLSSESRRSPGVVQASGVSRVEGRLAARHRFRHALYQRFLYDHLDPAERLRLHEATARALEELYRDHADPPVVELAEHFDEAGLTEPAIEYLYRAGQRALAMSAAEEALGLLTRARTLLATLPESPERDERELELLAQLGGAVMAARGYGAADAEEIGLRVLELCDRSDPSATAVVALLGLGSALSVGGRYGEAEAVFAMTRSINEVVQDDAAEVEIDYQVGFTKTFMGDLAAGHECLQRSHERYDPVGHAWVTALGGAPGPLALVADGVNRVVSGHLDDGVRLADRGIALARELGHPLTTCFTLALGGSVVRLLRGDWRAAAEFTEEVGEVATREHFPFFQVAADLYRGQTIGYLGDPARAVGLIEEGLDAWAAMGTNSYRGFWLAALAEFEHAEGHDDRALDLAEAGLSEVRASGEHLSEPMLMVQRASLLGLRDRVAAIAALEGTIGTARTMGARLYELRAATELARFQLAAGEPSSAREVLTPVFSWFSEGLDSTFVLEARAVLDRL